LLQLSCRKVLFAQLDVIHPDARALTHLGQQGRALLGVIAKKLRPVGDVVKKHWLKKHGSAARQRRTASNIVMSLGAEIVWLLILALPIASIAWTITHEEVFREPRDFCQRKSQSCRRLLERKFFYVFTC